MAQSSATPFNHLRMTHPETFKALNRMLEEDGAPVCNNPVKKEPPLPRSPEEQSRIDADKRKRDSDAHALSMLVKTRRNPFGSWYEGLSTVHKISVQYDKWLGRYQCVKVTHACGLMLWSCESVIAMWIHIVYLSEATEEAKIQKTSFVSFFRHGWELFLLFANDGNLLPPNQNAHGVISCTKKKTSHQPAVD